MIFFFRNYKYFIVFYIVLIQINTTRSPEPAVLQISGDIKTWYRLVLLAMVVFDLPARKQLSEQSLACPH